MGGASYNIGMTDIYRYNGLGGASYNIGMTDGVVLHIISV